MSSPMSMGGGGDGDFSSYTLPRSLWQLVEGFVPPDEINEVKLILGESIVDQGLELHEEVRAWWEYGQSGGRVVSR